MARIPCLENTGRPWSLSSRSPSPACSPWEMALPTKSLQRTHFSSKISSRIFCSEQRDALIFIFFRQKKEKRDQNLFRIEFILVNSDWLNLGWCGNTSKIFTGLGKCLLQTLSLPTSWSGLHNPSKVNTLPTPALILVLESLWEAKMESFGLLQEDIPHWRQLGYNCHSRPTNIHV